MSILIKGMKIPERCDARCPLYSTTGAYDCTITKKWYNWGLTERPSDCPLVEVPPHGRLIDADALKARLFPEKIDGIKTSITVSCMKLVIDDAPTVIEAEDGE